MTATADIAQALAAIAVDPDAGTRHRITAARTLHECNYLEHLDQDDPEPPDTYADTIRAARAIRFHETGREELEKLARWAATRQTRATAWTRPEPELLAACRFLLTAPPDVATEVLDRYREHITAGGELDGGRVRRRLTQLDKAAAIVALFGPVDDLPTAGHPDT